jgi:hypothetical protein
VPSFSSGEVLCRRARVQSQVERSEPEGNLDGFLARLHNSEQNEGRPDPSPLSNTPERYGGNIQGSGLWSNAGMKHRRMAAMKIGQRQRAAVICTVVLWAVCGQAQGLPPIRNSRGLSLLVADENVQPTLRVVLPGSADTDGAIEVIFPEHVSARMHGSTEAEHLYLFRPGRQGEHPSWREVKHSLEYERDFQKQIHFLARATLEEDGVRFHYEFTNHSDKRYDMIYAVTDPRMTGIFHDVRLERTYVHHKEGFDLLASETPNRLTMPLSQWLPSRYLASYTWPVPTQRVEHREDGITYYNKSRAVDEPMVATQSTDHKWVVASFTRTTGNVWSNPELTCQHVDAETSLDPGQQAVLEVKILVLQGTLDDALHKVIAQRDAIK